MATQQDLQTVFDQSDTLYRENKWKEAFDILSPYADNDPSDVELLWRLVRVFFRVSKFFSKDKEEAERLAKKGLELSKKALSIDDKNFQCQKVCEQVRNWLWGTGAEGAFALSSLPPPQKKFFFSLPLPPYMMHSPIPGLAAYFWSYD